MDDIYGIPKGMDTAAFEAHLDDKERARRRRQQELTPRNVDRWSKRAKSRDNRAAAKVETRKAAWSR
jgi:hypothetical protein